MTIAALLELNSIRSGLLPAAKFGSYPVYWKSDRQPFYAPNVFLLLEPIAFWAPFSLWMMTSFVLPITLAYFINLPLKAHPSHSYSTRRATTQANANLQLDPFVFNVAKGLICYIVYAMHFRLFGSYSNFTVSTVNEAVYGGYAGMLTSSGVGAAVALYEAILKK